MKGKRPFLWVPDGSGPSTVGRSAGPVCKRVCSTHGFVGPDLWSGGLFLFLGSLGTLFWRACLESDPVLRQHDHTVHDERNTAIRGKASTKNAGDPAGGADGRHDLDSYVGHIPAALGASVRDFCCWSAGWSSAVPSITGGRCDVEPRRIPP